jgi:serine/threonine protein kinase
METMCPACGISIDDDSDNSGQTITSCMRCGADLLIAAGAEPPRRTILGVAALYEDPTLNFGPAPLAASSGERPPERLGRYRILSPLGSGGFATVYLAVDEELHRQVAIKVPRKDRFLSENDYEEFFEEARVLARFEHPAIVPVYDVGTDGDVRFIVTRYVDGASLSTRLHRGAMSFAEAARIVSQCARAIHAAHKRQIYHRDLKPGNILLGKDGEVFVADFGLALSRNKMQPMAREVSGTPRYMSPEQIRGDIVRLDGRSDIWSLGVVLYRLLTGTEPFVGNGRQLAMEIQEKPPVPLRQHNELIPGVLEEICLRCLNKQPELRYQTAFDLARDLEEWLRSDSGTLTQAASVSTVSPQAADTAEGMSSPTLPFASRWVPAGPFRRVATYAGGGAMLLLIAFVFSNTREKNAVLNPSLTTKTATAKIEPKVTEDIPGKWRQLLVREPNKLIFPNVGPARMLYDSVREEVTLHTPEAGYVSLQETSESDYLFSVRLHRSNWIGGAGLFFGFKPSLWEDGRVLNQCLAVSVNGFQLDNKMDYYLKVDRLIITPNARIHDNVSPGPLLSKKISNPATKDYHSIEVKVVDDRLHSVSWDGEVIFRYPIEILKVEWVRDLPETSASGTMGIFSRSGDTMFSDARFMSTKFE